MNQIRHCPLGLQEYELAGFGLMLVWMGRPGADITATSFLDVACDQQRSLILPVHTAAVVVYDVINPLAGYIVY